MTNDEKYILEEIVIEETDAGHKPSCPGALDSLAHRDHATARANAFVSASIHGATYALREWVGPQEAAAVLRKFADAIDVQAATQLSGYRHVHAANPPHSEATAGTGHTSSLPDG